MTEGYVLLALVERLVVLCKNLNEGLVTVYFDNKYLLNKLTTIEKKASKWAEDCSAICSQIDDILNTIIVDVIFEYSNDKIKWNEMFEEIEEGILLNIATKDLKREEKMQMI